MRTRKFIVGLEFSAPERKAEKMKKLARALKVSENPYMSLKVVVSDEVSYTPVRCQRLKNPTEGNVRFTASLLNARYFSGAEGELRYVKGRDENGEETFSLRLCGRNSDAFHFADGEDGFAVTGRTESFKKLYDSVRDSEKAKIFERLRGFDLDHGQREPFSDETHAAVTAAAKDEKMPKTKGPLSRRPESEKSPVPREAPEARLKLLSGRGAKTVRDTVSGGNFPDFAALCRGGPFGDDSAKDGAPTDTELKLLHLPANASEGSEGAVRIFKSSGAYDPAKPYSFYARAAREAWTEAAKFKKEHKREEASTEAKLQRKEGDYGKEI